MQTLNSQINWQHHTEAQHWIKHSLLPVALIVAFLWLPNPWSLALFQPNNAIEIELIESQATITEMPVTQPEPLDQPPPTLVLKNPLETPIETAPKEVRPNITEQKPQQVITAKPNTTPQINSTDVLQMIQNRKSIDITTEFQARTQPATDFYIPEQQIQDWMTDIPYLDESVDKPKLQMQFYAEGFTGSIEKFFDKITIKKTFTTKYGTKIHCALIGVIAACGWK